MFCPLCKAEYREGFYRCVDCGVDLVNFLEEPLDEGADVKGEPLELLWRGQDPVVFTATLNALREEQIPCHDLATRDPEGLPWSPFRVGHAGQGFEIRVFRSDLEKAQRVLETVLEPLLAGSGSEAAPEVSSERIEARAEGTMEDWTPQDATAEVWSGEDRAMARFLADTFRENGIPSRSLVETGTHRILVRAKDSERARDIVREVIKGTPPA